MSDAVAAAQQTLPQDNITFLDMNGVDADQVSVAPERARVRKEETVTCKLCTAYICSGAIADACALLEALRLQLRPSGLMHVLAILKLPSVTASLNPLLAECRTIVVLKP